jgi:hypothetical protein
LLHCKSMSAFHANEGLVPPAVKPARLLWAAARARAGGQGSTLLREAVRGPAGTGSTPAASLSPAPVVSALERRARSSARLAPPSCSLPHAPSSPFCPDASCTAQIDSLHHVISCSPTDSFAVDLELSGPQGGGGGGAAADAAPPTVQVLQCLIHELAPPHACTNVCRRMHRRAPKPSPGPPAASFLPAPLRTAPAPVSSLLLLLYRRLHSSTP